MAKNLVLKIIHDFIIGCTVLSFTHKKRATPIPRGRTPLNFLYQPVCYFFTKFFVTTPLSVVIRT